MTRHRWRCELDDGLDILDIFRALVVEDDGPAHLGAVGIDEKIIDVELAHFGLRVVADCGIEGALVGACLVGGEGPLAGVLGFLQHFDFLLEN